MYFTVKQYLQQSPDEHELVVQAVGHCAATFCLASLAALPAAR